MNSPSMNSLATKPEQSAVEASAAAASFDREGWRRLSTMGVFHALVDPAMTPAQGVREVANRMRAFGQDGESPGLLFAVATHLASTITSVNRFGSQALKEELLPALLSGEAIGAHAITEAAAGSDASSMQATATVDETDGSVLLQGTKIYITNAPIATHMVVYARTYLQGEDQGISAYVVRSSAPGVSVTAKHQTSSLPASPIGEVHLDNVHVPAGYRLGAEGSGLQILDYVMKREIIYAFSADLGRIQRRIQECVKFANSRQQFGSRIAAFQSVSFTIAEMYIHHLAGESMINEVLSKLEANKDITKEVAAAKVLISETNLNSAVQASQILGARGVEEFSSSIQAVVDALAGPIYSGTNRIQKTRIAAMLGLITDA